jgi:hypothetical protein
MNFVEMLIYGATEQMRRDVQTGRFYVNDAVWLAAVRFRWFFFPPNRFLGGFIDHWKHQPTYQ